MKGLDVTDRVRAQQSFNILKSKNDRVDWVAVMAVMILMSDQKFISKVTFLFSLCDFNSSREVNCAELCIGMRYLFLGISRCFTNATLPPKSEVEASTVEVFSRIDADRTRFICIEEIVSFAYMSKDLRVLLTTFPSTDDRIFEELVVFTGNNRAQQAAADKLVNNSQQKMIKELQLTPDPAPEQNSRRQSQRKQRDRPWKANLVITKPYAMSLYRTFSELQDGSGTISMAALAKFSGDHEHVRSKLMKWTEQSDRAAGEDRKTQQQIITKVSIHLTDRGFMERLEEYGDAVSLRALFCLCCPAISEAEIDDGMRWCLAYRAHDILTELLKYNSSPMTDEKYDPAKQNVDIDLSAEDVDALFQALDIDGDGHLSLKELCQGGDLQSEDARKLINLWDRDRSGELSKSEILAIIHQVHHSVRQTMKGMFARNNSL